MKISVLSRFVFVASLLLLLTAFGCRTNQDELPEEQPQEDSSVVIGDSGDGSGDSQDASSQDSQDGGSTTPQPGSDTQDSTPESDAPQDDAGVDSGDQQVAIEFAEQIVEIYGSFTNKSAIPYKNIRDIELFATDSFKTFLDEQASQPINSNAPFYGVTSTPLSTAVLEFNQNNATLLVTVKREEVTENARTAREFYAVIEVELERAGNEWKVSGLFWQ